MSSIKEKLERKNEKNASKNKIILLDKASDLSTSDSKTFSGISANFSMIFAWVPFSFPKLVD